MNTILPTPERERFGCARFRQLETVERFNKDGEKLKEVTTQTHQWIRRKSNNRQGKDALDIFEMRYFQQILAARNRYV